MISMPFAEEELYHGNCSRFSQPLVSSSFPLVDNFYSRPGHKGSFRLPSFSRELFQNHFAHDFAQILNTASQNLRFSLGVRSPDLLIAALRKS
jgi:hypothetical protein